MEKVGFAYALVVTAGGVMGYVKKGEQLSYFVIDMIHIVITIVWLQADSTVSVECLTNFVILVLGL